MSADWGQFARANQALPTATVEVPISLAMRGTRGGRNYEWVLGNGLPLAWICSKAKPGL